MYKIMNRQRKYFLIDGKKVPFIGGGKGGCFAARTMVSTPKGLVPIEDIRTGDFVTSFDDEGELFTSQVSQVFIHYDQPLIKVVLWGGCEIRVTPNHWFLNEFNSFNEIGNFNIDDIVITEDNTLLPITAIQEIDLEPTYNLTIPDNHTYIANGIRVHNKGGGKSQQAAPGVEDPNTLFSTDILFLTVALGEGPMYRINPNGPQDIEINEDSIDDLVVLSGTGTLTQTDKFKLLNTTGTLTQGPLPVFGDEIVTPQNLAGALELKAGNVPGVPRSALDLQSTSNDRWDALRFTFTIGTLQIMDDEGNVSGNTITVRVTIFTVTGEQIRSIDRTISGKTNTPYKFEIEVVIPEVFKSSAGYKFSISKISNDSDSSKNQATVGFQSWIEIKNDDQAYPRTALIGYAIKAFAEHKGAVPTFTCLAKGLLTKVPSNYNQPILASGEIDWRELEVSDDSGNPQGFIVAGYSLQSGGGSVEKEIFGPASFAGSQVTTELNSSTVNAEEPAGLIENDVMILYHTTQDDVIHTGPTGWNTLWNSLQDTDGITTSAYWKFFSPSVELDISLAVADGITLNADTQIDLLDGQFLFGAALWFKPDGTRLFVMNYLGPATMYQFDLSTPWLASSGILTASFIIDSPPGTLDLGIGELMFNAAGTSFYLVRNDLGGGGPDGLYKFVLGTAWDLTTAAALPPGTPLVFGTGFFPEAISFGNDGLKLYFIDGDLLDTIHQWTLTIAYDTTTATDDNNTLGLKAITTLGAGGTLSLSSQLRFTDDGLKMIASSTQYDPDGVGSPNRGGLIQYNLSVAWDTSTCTHFSSLDLSDDIITKQPFGMFFKPDLTKVFIYTEGNFPDRIHQYSLPSSGSHLVSSSIPRPQAVAIVGYRGADLTTPIDTFATQTEGSAVDVIFSPSISASKDSTTIVVFASTEGGQTDGNHFTVGGGMLEKFEATVNAQVGSSTFADFSPSAHVGVFQNTATFSSSTKKFGLSSMELTSAGDAIDFPDSNDWVIGGSEAFTVEMWYNPDSVMTGANAHLIGQWGAAGQRSWRFSISPPNLEFVFSEDGTSEVIISGTNVITTDSFAHYAISRETDGDIRLFVDGDVVGNGNNANTFFNATSNLWVGTVSGDPANVALGFIDDVRVTKGLARYTGAFTPPVNPHGISVSDDGDFLKVILCLPFDDSGLVGAAGVKLVMAEQNVNAGGTGNRKVSMDLAAKSQAATIAIKPIEGTNSPTNPQIYKGLWDGSFVHSWTQNPVWILYDLLTNTTYGLNIPEANIDKFRFYNVAQYCDAVDPATGKWAGVEGLADGTFRHKPRGFFTGGREVLVGLGETVRIKERRFCLDIVISSQQQVMDIINKIAATFRGVLFYSGGKISLNVDLPDEIPVAIFNEGNIKKDSMTISGIPESSLLTGVEVTYIDVTNHFRRDIVKIDDHQMLEEQNAIENIAQIETVGVTRKGQAVRMAQYLLAASKFIRRKVTFKTTIEAINLAVGDVISIQNRIIGVAWGYGGRVLANGGVDSDTVVLEHFTSPAITSSVLTGNTLPLALRLIKADQDTVELYLVSNSAFTANASGNTQAGIDTLQLTIIAKFNPKDKTFSTNPIVYKFNDEANLVTGISTIPSKGDLWTFGEVDPGSYERSTSDKLFKIIALERDTEEQISITASEYITNVYIDSDTLISYDPVRFVNTASPLVPPPAPTLALFSRPVRHIDGSFTFDIEVSATTDTTGYPLTIDTQFEHAAPEKSQIIDVLTNDITIQDYITVGTLFDGATEWLALTDILNAAGSKTSSISMWVKLNAGSKEQVLFAIGNGIEEDILRCNVRPDDTIQVIGRNSSGAIILDMESANTLVVGSWTHIGLSWDLDTAGTGRVTLGGNNTKVENTYINDAINWPGAGLAIGANWLGVDKYDGCFSEMWMDDSNYIDFNVNFGGIGSFVKSNGKPNDLGVLGANPLGIAAGLMLRHSFESFEDNEGNFGSFLVIGTLEACPDSPSN